jgi:hypothetical protein
MANVFGEYSKLPNNVGWSPVLSPTISYNTSMLKEK